MKQKSQGKPDIKKKRLFREKFSTWNFCKNIFVVFLDSPYRETPKILLKKSQEKKYLGLVGSSKANQIHAGAGVRRFFFSAPCALRRNSNGPARRWIGTRHAASCALRTVLLAIDIDILRSSSGSQYPGHMAHGI
jgi:hypothetical protein